MPKSAKTGLAKALTEALQHGLKTGNECLLHIDRRTGKSVYSKVEGTMLERLSRKTNIAWIDPATGKHPDYIFDDTITNASRFAEFLEKVIEPDKRYTLEFLWTNRGRTAHIISVDRTADGILRLYDPQNGKTYIKQEALEYLKQLKYSKILPPKILRIDDKQFNLDVVNYIMEGVRK